MLDEIEDVDSVSVRMLVDRAYAAINEQDAKRSQPVCWPWRVDTISDVEELDDERCGDAAPTGGPRRGRGPWPSPRRGPEDREAGAIRAAVDYLDGASPPQAINVDVLRLIREVNAVGVNVNQMTRQGWAGVQPQLDELEHATSELIRITKELTS